jgi:hypothetical protein
MAVGDRSEKRLAGPYTLGTTNSTVGSAVPTSRVWVTKQITITNTNALDATFRLAIGSAVTAGNCFFYDMPIAAYDTMVFDTSLVLIATEYISGYSNRGAINVVITGWEKEV